MYIFNLPMDHVAFSTSDRQATEILLHKLGFVFGSGAKDPFIHVIFDNGYLEWVPSSYDTKSNLENADGLTAGIRAYYMAVTDIDNAHDALIDNNYRVHPVGSFSRYGKHGTNRGQVSFDYCIFKEQTIFSTNIGLGCTKQNNPERIYDGHYRHVNDVDTVLKLVYCAANATESASALNKLSVALEKCGDRTHGIAQVAIMDNTEYAELFGHGCDCSDRLSLAAVCFSGCDAQYMQQQLEDLNIPFFTKEKNLIVDLRKQLGAYFIFEQE